MEDEHVSAGRRIPPPVKLPPKGIGHFRHALAARHVPGALAQDATATVTNHGAGPRSRTHLGAVALHDLYGHAFVTGLHVAVLITLAAAALTFTAMRTPPCTD